VVILKTIAHMEGHPSAQEAYEKARVRLPGLNIATFCQTLDTLHHAGFINIFPNSSDVMLFAFHDDNNIHSHLHCIHCGRVLKLGIEPFRLFFAGSAQEILCLAWGYFMKLRETGPRLNGK
jgi:Fe2+ or Zn2+ uptake regulation protein